MGYAIMTTRTLELDWKMRALHVLPMFLVPGLSFLTYSALSSFSRIRKYWEQLLYATSQRLLDIVLLLFNVLLCLK